VTRIVKRLIAIATIVSAVQCCLFLALMLASYDLSLCSDDSQNGVWVQNSIPLASHFRVGFSRGSIWFFSLDCPYTGSLRQLADGDGIAYPGGHARIMRDHVWVFRNSGFVQETYIGELEEFVGRNQYGDFPGLYYRHFEWMRTPTEWTLALSLWYPIALVAVLPLVWLIRNRQTVYKKWHDIQMTPQKT